MDARFEFIVLENVIIDMHDDAFHHFLFSFYSLPSLYNSYELFFLKYMGIFFRII